MPPAGATCRGSIKHKARSAPGRKGTLCPEWSHNTPTHGLGSDMAGHDWNSTEGHRLFSASVDDPDGSRKLYATKRGIAFVAQPTEDGSWHGYPEPWNRVPSELKDRWRRERAVSARDLRRYADFPETEINWALGSDDD